MMVLLDEDSDLSTRTSGNFGSYVPMVGFSGFLFIKLIYVLIHIIFPFHIDYN